MQSPKIPAQNNFPELLRSIERMALEGYATFPTQHKRPLHGGENWKNAPIDNLPAASSYPLCEYGIVLRADDLVVDVDPRNFPLGRNSFREFLAENNVPEETLKNTRVIQSGNGGVHIYLNKPPVFAVRRHLKGFPGLDFLSYGSYVVGPGSFVDGKEYKFLADNPIIQAPQELLNAITKTSGPDFTPPVPDQFRDVPENTDRFIDYLKTVDAATQGQRGDATTYSAACKGRDFYLSPDMCYRLMSKHYNPRCRPQWTAVDLKQKVINAYRYAGEPAGTLDPAAVFPDMTKGHPEKEDDDKWLGTLDRTGPGAIKNTLKNCTILIEQDRDLKNKFRFNEFSYRIEIDGNMPWEKDRTNPYREINDLEAIHVGVYLAKKYNVEFAPPKIWDSLLLVAGKQGHHPIKKWLGELVWDRLERLDTWLITYCGALDTPFVRAIGAKTLVAAVARIYEPGRKFDMVLVFEGLQGSGKSTACSILGGDYFGDSPIDVHNMKDTVLYLHAHWIIEFSEMSGVRKADVNKLKTFLSAQEDDARPAYARARVRFPRQCIFIGTINPDDTGYLSDDTGNRRFWPVYCNRFDLAALQNDRDQLFAEARARYRKGESLFLDESLYPVAAQEAEERRIQDPWTDIIAEYLQANPDMGKVTSADIFIKCLGGNNGKFNTGDARRIVVALKSLGFRKHKNGTGNNEYRREVILGINPFGVIDETL